VLNVDQQLALTTVFDRCGEIHRADAQLRQLLFENLCLDHVAAKRSTAGMIDTLNSRDRVSRTDHWHDLQPR
jgi:hypothetical protein